jgi:hypothetical protein
MIGKSYPDRALAAYYRELARQKRVSLPIDNLPTRACEATMEERDYVMVCHGSRTLAVYRVKPGGLLHRLTRWPKELDRRL